MTSHQSYEALLTLDTAAREEVLWWRDHLQGWNGKALFQHPIELIIETDASRKGWGAYCEGVSTGGPWCLGEKKLHINCLELLAGSFAIKTFTKTKACAHVKLMMDNAAAVAYINKMGGTHSHALANLAIALWEWCLNNQLIVSAQHLPGKLNTRADRESGKRLETQPQPVSGNSENMGPFRNRSVCISPDIPTSSLRQLEARSPSHADRCLYHGLADNPRVCLPTICLNRSMLAAGNISEGRTISPNNASMANSTLVPIGTPIVHRSPSATSNISRSLNEGQPNTSSNQPTVGWLETVSQRFETTEVSAETREILLAAWRRNTTNAYASAWGKWVSWCGEREINPISVSLNTILEFLKDQFKDGKAYRTINVYRSALSAVLPEIDSNKVGTHPLVSQLLKGIFHLRHPEPKYSHTWSVSQVLDYIKSLGSNEGLSLKVLSLKLVTLLALTAPDRSSDLAKKDLRFRNYHPKWCVF